MKQGLIHWRVTTPPPKNIWKGWVVTDKINFKKMTQNCLKIVKTRLLFFKSPAVRFLSSFTLQSTPKTCRRWAAPSNIHPVGPRTPKKSSLDPVLQIKHTYTTPEKSSPFCVHVIYDNVIIYNVYTEGATFFGDSIVTMTTRTRYTVVDYV